VSGCRRRRRARRVYHKTNSTHERAERAGRRRSLSANASGWITAACVDVRPTASALIWRRQRAPTPPGRAAASSSSSRLYIVAVRRAVADAAD